jgi:hypothetical protein
MLQRMILVGANTYHSLLCSNFQFFSGYSMISSQWQAASAASAQNLRHDERLTPEMSGSPQHRKGGWVSPVVDQARSR